jgi:hypothetical protein
VLKVQKGGESDRRSEKDKMVNARDVQQFVGILFGFYGFFVAISPERYTIPYLNALWPTITLQQQSFAGFLLLVFGVFLFTRRRALIQR